MATIEFPVNVSWSGASGSPGVNVWHCRTTSVDFDNEDFQGLIDIVEAFYTTVKGIYTGSTDLDFIGEGHGVGDDSGNTYTADSWHIDAGPTSDFMPPANAVLINWKTPSGGRQGRGRTFLGPLNASQTEGNGTPSEPCRTLVQGAADDLIESSDSFGNGALGVYSRVGDTFRDFVSADVPNFFAVLRSRRD